MNEPKPFASLSSGLLARKGAAKPAMRPQGYGNFGSSLEDLGWDDMGHHEPQPVEHVPSSISALTPAPGGRGHDEPEIAEPEYDESADYIEPVEQAEPVHPPAVIGQRRILEESFEPEAEYEPEPEAEPEAAYEPEQAAFEPEMEIEPEPEPEIEAEIEPAPAPRPAPVVSLPRRQPAAPAPAPVPAVSARSKAAFTLRLDAERHLLLRLACAVTRRSAQQIVTGALDEFLGAMPELEALAGQVPAAGKRAG